MARKPPKSSKSSKQKPRKTASTPAPTGRGIQRRQVLKGVVAGSGVVASAMALPKEWTKPVVQSIVASAHAQVSPPPPFNPSTFVPQPFLPTSPIFPVIPTFPPGFFPPPVFTPPFPPSVLTPSNFPSLVNPSNAPSIITPSNAPLFPPF